MIILDSSAAIRAVLASDVSDIYFQMISKEKKIVSPSIFLSETANALWKEVRFNNLSVDLLPHMMRTLSAMTVTSPDEDFIEGALNIAIDTQHPVYDCLFIAMSREMNAPVLTADKKLRRKFPDDQFVDVDI